MKKILAILLALIFCFNIAIPVQATEVEIIEEENFATQHHNYLMGLIKQLLNLLNNIFDLIQLEEEPTEPQTTILIWKTPKGKKYHIDAECAGPTASSWEVEISSIASEDWCGTCAVEYK